MKKLLDIVLIWIPAVFLVISLSWVITYKWIPVKWTPLMLRRSLEYAHEKDFSNNQTWVDLEHINPFLVEAVLLSEDQRFFSHNGFDLTELKKMKEEHDHYGKEIRGCSTISQQVAKNCFTFGTGTLLRKALEAYYTVLIEFIWGKERILEVYLNVAETGKGLYGMEAACQVYFKCFADDVDIEDAVALVCTLPRPLTRTPASVRTTHASKISKHTKKLIDLYTEAPIGRQFY
jgi:monofunctional biosynthetic peptidoglycan transglycosylase